ncbi:PREDICTED: uncharacterized protein LOC109232665 [Nicotiana attenuata]|uniref:uncharacterized protein LOC109232665 n=1 Tax=Nicotiana attenuata TaxID=49451 RepID=UPI000905689C|nr:PREDICTED: uncharacterized protein LOC109232665 [Nicotiana attenuata]
MASAIGTPIYADECTAKKKRVSFARMLIEVNITRELPMEIKVMDPNGKTFQQDVRYDWKPEFCQKCLVVGHRCGMEQQQYKQQDKQQGKRREAKKVTMEWRTKDPVKEGVNSAGEASLQQKEAQILSQREVADKENIQPMVDQENAQQDHIQTASQQQSKVEQLMDKGKAIEDMFELDMIDFPALSPIAMRNSFGPLNKGSWCTSSVPPDKGWNYATNYQDASNGRIWFTWDSQWYNVTILSVAAQFIHCLVQDRVGIIDCAVTAIYGYNTIEQRKLLWSGLKDIAAGDTKICGDFNAVLYTNDRLMGNPITYIEVQDFADCVANLALNELAWTGDYYTWSNKQH